MMFSVNRGLCFGLLAPILYSVSSVAMRALEIENSTGPVTSLRLKTLGFLGIEKRSQKKYQKRYHCFEMAFDFKIERHFLSNSPQFMRI